MAINLAAPINIFMRVTPRRSCPYSAHCLLQTFLLGVSLVTTCPAWSLPLKLTSHSAIDLVEKQQSEKVGVINTPDTSSQKLIITSVTILTPQPAIAKPAQTSQPSDVAASPAQNTLSPEPQTPIPKPAIDFDPKLIDSPVLQRWLKRVPDVLADIKRDPSFRTRLRLGYAQFHHQNKPMG